MSPESRVLVVLAMIISGLAGFGGGVGAGVGVGVGIGAGVDVGVGAGVGVGIGAGAGAGVGVGTGASVAQPTMAEIIPARMSINAKALNILLLFLSLKDIVSPLYYLEC
jgi:hypothetical protein